MHNIYKYTNGKSAMKQINKQTNKQSTLQNNIQFITAIIVLLCIGIYFSWPQINVPFRQITNEVLENVIQMRVNIILALIFLGIGAVISILISKHVSSKLRIILSALMLFTCFFSLSMQTITFHYTSNYILLYLSYAFLGGTASGIVLVPTTNILNTAFKGKKIIGSVIVFGCILTGSFILGNIINLFASTENGSWKNIYTTIAIIMGIIIFISSFILKPTNESYVKSMKIEEEEI